MSANDNPVDGGERSFWLELAKAAKALSITESRADAERLRQLLDDLRHLQIQDGGTAVHSASASSTK